MNIKELRKELGVSQRAISETYGIPFRTVQNWEYLDNMPDYIYNLLERVMREDVESGSIEVKTKKSSQDPCIGRKLIVRDKSSEYYEEICTVLKRFDTYEVAVDSTGEVIELFKNQFKWI